jgi:hypothetical protein
MKVDLEEKMYCHPRAFIDDHDRQLVYIFLFHIIFEMSLTIIYSLLSVITRISYTRCRMAKDGEP